VAPEIHYLDSEQVVATRGPLVMRVVERATTEPSDIDRVLELMEQLARTGDKVGIMIVVHHGAPVPRPAVLRYMASTIPRVRELGAAVFVMLGLGFWAMAAQRSVLALAELAGMPVPVTSELEAGARKLAALVPGLDAETVISTYESAANKMTINPSGS
jgi:hypothetical protein